MDHRARVRRDIEDTLAAHVDRGDGRCAGFHGEWTLPGDTPATPPGVPCPVAAHFAQVRERAQREQWWNS